MNEIEEFLKRAAAMRARQQGAQPVAPSQVPPRATPAPLPFRRPATSLVQDAEVVEAVEVTTGDDVAEHVARHLDSGLFKERAAHLGEGIKATDEVIESHLHDTFEHRLGALGATTARAEDSTLDDDETAATQAAAALLDSRSLSALLSSPQNLRNAIILTEILNPSRARW